jgi:NAD(P)-dependent dehydrogenase (short-subunit alcohol dehydrogenase family)
MTEQGRRVWITGAGSGIGAEAAKCFALRGDRVFATARSEEKLRQLKAHIDASHAACETAVCDVCDESSVAGTGRKIFKLFGGLDMLVNNAGVTYFKDFMETTTREFDHVLNTNLRGPFLCTQAVLPAMIAQGSGLILNVLSFVTKQVYTKSAAYSASKAGAEAMMNVLRAEVRRRGIQIVNVYPGAVRTPIWPERQILDYGDQMLDPQQAASILYQISRQPSALMVEEVTFRPQGGDIEFY